MKTKILIIGSLATTLAFGAGFNCKKASTPTEKTICSHKYLGLMDESMSVLYDTYNTALDVDIEENNRVAKQSRAKLVATQKEFLGKREACKSNASCIYNITNQRISAIDKIMGGHDNSLSVASNSGLALSPNLKSGAKMELAYENLYNAISAIERVKLANEQKKFNKSIDKAWDRLVNDGTCGSDRSACHEEAGTMKDARTKVLQNRLKSVKK